MLQQLKVALGAIECGDTFNANFVERIVASLKIGNGAILLLNEHNVLLFRVMWRTPDIVRLFFPFS